MTEIKEISCDEALAELQNDSAVVYLDVRSIQEFVQGHPIRAINIPILHFSPGMGMMPNDEFQKVVEANLSREARIVIGCKTGVRSARACEILTQLGFSNVANVRGGFVGVMDPFGRVIEPGWSLLDFPVCNNCSEDAQYEALVSKAKNKQK
jgi:rhodanese-related sulfurtransferase